MEPDIYALSKAGFSKERIEEITGCDDKEILMMKKVITVLTSLLMILSLAACGNSAGRPGSLLRKRSRRQAL